MELRASPWKSGALHLTMGKFIGEGFLKNHAWTLSVLLLLATTSFSAGAAPAGGRKMFKWVDEQGVTHDGDHIPPEYATQEQHVVNSQGIETERIEAQKTPDQMAAEENKKFDAAQKASRLSGGNQQKVVLAKWLFRHARLFIFDEPTRGIDVGAKSEIYRLMNQLAESGAAILMVSSELPEILGMTDRVLVMRSGRIAKELVTAETTQEEIIRYATLGQ